jgi:hypothetical protein
MGDAVPQLAERRKRRFADFSEEPVPLDGDKIKIDDILNREIEIIGFRIGRTKYSKNQSGKYVTLQIKLDGKIYVVFTGSDIVISQIEKYAEQIPFLSTIKKINRYYTLS